ncbi:hypothetical protein EVAR_97357_1 [Eumeta japonica]|uniref:Uncharacterized protein n=1 Tax=Eumeta variegata TaxID=151549 RepID=A0A4C1YYZ3_EUMVA|nr:hypothetical protein EVAR_97357_1 [Eumeta japonica]
MSGRPPGWQCRAGVRYRGRSSAVPKRHAPAEPRSGFDRGRAEGRRTRAGARRYLYARPARRGDGVVVHCLVTPRCCLRGALGVCACFMYHFENQCSPRMSTNCGAMCGCRKAGMKCSAVCFHCSGETCSNVMELSELINENDFDDEPPTLTLLQYYLIQKPDQMLSRSLVHRND